MHKSIQFIKYGIVGAINTLIDLAALYIFVEYLHIEIILAATLSFLLAVINSFLLNKIWTFKNTSKNYRKQFIKFLIVSIVGLGLNTAFMLIFTKIFLVWYMLSKAMTSIIVLIWNFLVNKYWTFKIWNRPLPENSEPVFDLSIIIPAFDEERRIKKTLEEISKYVNLKNLNTEIIVVNDGSTDKTKEVVEDFAKTHKNISIINYKKNEGKGFAVKQGVIASKGRYILFADADNSTPIGEFEKMISNLRKFKANIAIGSRYLSLSDVQIKQPIHRIILSRFGNFLIQLFLIEGIKDTQCGFKLFERKAAKEIFDLQKVKRFGFDMETLTIAESLGYKIVEVPVSWFNSTESRFRPIKDGLRTLRDLVYIKLNILSGRYNSDDLKTK